MIMAHGAIKIGCKSAVKIYNLLMEGYDNELLFRTRAFERFERF